MSSPAATAKGSGLSLFLLPEPSLLPISTPRRFRGLCVLLVLAISGWVVATWLTRRNCGLYNAYGAGLRFVTATYRSFPHLAPLGVYYTLGEGGVLPEA